MILPPPIDLAEVCGPSARARRRQFELLDAALSRTGYAHLEGHGIPRPLTNELFAVTRGFFDEPVELKETVMQPAPEQVRGWSGVGSEGIAYSLDEESHGDLKEKMDIGPVDRPTLGRPGASPMAFPNLWPGRPEGFRPVWEAYYRHMQRVGAGLLALSAEGFGLARDHFVPMFADELSMLRALHYPPQVEAPLPYQYRAGTHTDYGAFTLVCAEATTGGLQVYDHDGEWLEVTTTPVSLVVLVGDLLAEWTANHWSATVHRTANPPRSVGFESSRLAFAFYQHPSHDTAVAELPPFTENVSPAAHELLAGQHLIEKYVRQTTFGRHTVQD
ncbi:isopenicillin N synthase family dioxygenase [Mycobacterium sp. NPDC003449]